MVVPLFDISFNDLTSEIAPRSDSVSLAIEQTGTNTFIQNAISVLSDNLDYSMSFMKHHRLKNK
ncbi:MAG: hypothetical protein ACOC2M_04625 [bacterium]